MKILPRIAALMLASAAIAFTMAGTASANTPMMIVADGGSTMKIHDDENVAWEATMWEYKTFSLSGLVFGTLGAGNAVFNHKHARCWGNEVRGELIVDAHRWSNTNAATITAHIDLYEGASCSTTDHDGQSPFVTFTLKPGEARTVQLRADNNDEGDADHAAAKVTFRAVPL
ncbi:hypothetical protein DVA67_019190 [Solirubrobacter sp. CPCC 204708]|uniref:Uncharacterized protein n=1 Tax=Solirubrobacter deserti TaxID=2282478 RepID=A0ABT4RFS0_9ACTN|nr:hypothetical protein [Solirubrobacter deserti]MBE2318115.1 hypothetical protein [Solirubrobacter deserti]MDA0137393.1 hypothetical protein [Solirubrobacter deserti]